MRSKTLGRAVLALLAVCVLAAVPVAKAENFNDPNVAAMWSTFTWSNTVSDYGPFTATVADGVWREPVPTMASTYDCLWGMGTANETVGAFGSYAAGTGAYYDGQLLGDLTGRCVVIKYRLDSDLVDTTAFVNTDFIGEKYGWIWGYAPEEIRSSFYIRMHTGATGPDGYGENNRWFNEPMGNRMFFAAAGSDGLEDSVWATMVVPMWGKNFNNYWGYFRGDDETYKDPNIWDKTGAEYFAETVANVESMRFQFDSGYSGTGGFGFNDDPNLGNTPSGNIEVDGFYSVSPGDSDLDGDVDGDDYFAIINNFTGDGGTGKWWTSGDFDGDGDCDGDDYFTVINNFTVAMSVPMTMPELTPEPITMVLMLTGGVALTSRRRRHN